MNTSTERKAERYTQQAMRCYGMTRKNAVRWAGEQIARDAEDAARNATLVTTYYAERLGCAVTVPGR